MKKENYEGVKSKFEKLKRDLYYLEEAIKSRKSKKSKGHEEYNRS